MAKLASALREPLLHFLALGALIFLAYAWLGDDAPDADAIVITRGQQISLLETFERTWGRPPTPDEFAGVVQDYLREEIAYREGSARELDRNDTVIRRRLRQKLELLAEDLAAIAPPTEAELDASYAANAESFRTESRYSFEQIVFSPDLRGDSARADAVALLASLRGGASVTAEALAGDSRVLPHELAAAGERQIASTFGSEFLAALEGLTPGVWEGPVASGFGWHLVRIAERIPGEVPPLAEVLDRVQTELLVERRRAALEQLYASLAQRYSIRVEPLTEPAAAAAGE